MVIGLWCEASRPHAYPIFNYMGGPPRTRQFMPLLLDDVISARTFADVGLTAPWDGDANPHP